MFFDALIPALAPSDHLGWLRWRVPLIAFATIAVISLIVQLLILSAHEVERERREKRKDEEDAVRDSTLKRLVAGAPIIQASAVAAVSVNESVARKLTGEDPRIYVDVDEVKADRWGTIKTPFTLKNEGGEVAHKICIENLSLLMGEASFPSIEALSSKDAKTVEPELGNMFRFEKHNIAALMLKEWDTAGKLTEEFVRSMRVTFEDFRKAKFETTFDLVFEPIVYILRKKPSFHESYESKKTLTIRNLEIRPL
jgi:hypothetical protein